MKPVAFYPFVGEPILIFLRCVTFGIIIATTLTFAAILALN